MYSCVRNIPISNFVYTKKVRWDHTRMHLEPLCTHRMHYVRTLVYSIECSWYWCVYNLTMYFDVHKINLWELQFYTNRQLLPANRASRFYESMILKSESSYQNNRTIHFTLQLFLLSRIKFTFAMDPLWDGKHSHLPHCYNNWVVMATRVKPQ